MNEMSASTTLSIADIARVMQLLPHRYPMLMIDRVVDLVAGRSGTGIKNVSINEPYFQGHFPSHPVMPGVMIVESMAQTAGALVMYTLGADLGQKVVYFMTIDKCRFRHPVAPGDQLRIPVQIVRSRGPVWKFRGETYVGDTLVAEADFSAMIVDLGESAELPPE
jgi:3-hydroxyacyl-[acyl-carrier-protein] dehydratase